MRIRKTDLAESDLINIYRYGFDRFGASQADTYANDLFDMFDLLAQSSLIQRERREYSKPMRVHHFKAHVIIYLLEDATLVILRILYGKQNWPDHL